ncbi:hypothetical protein ABFV55_27650, partial [Pseudomonas syringae]|uniref:hypothetical protein n=1 Tax=Pseudomonas syringae TaxID=317 RepID=UPI0034D95477
MIWITKKLMTKAQDALILPRDLSDHCPMELTIFQREGARRWRLNEKLIKKEVDRSNYKIIIQNDLEIKDTKLTNVQITWDAMK